MKPRRTLQEFFEFDLRRDFPGSVGDGASDERRSERPLGMGATPDYCHLAGVYLPRVWWTREDFADAAFWPHG